MPDKSIDSLSLSQLSEKLSKNDPSEFRSQEVFSILRKISSLLGQAGEPQDRLRDVDVIRKLSLWVSKSMLPDNKCVAHDELPGNDAPESRQTAVTLSQQRAVLALNALSLLQFQQSGSSASMQSSDLDPQILLSLLAFTDARDPWTTPSIITSVNSLLSNHSEQLSSPDFVTNFLIQSFIRPLFSKSKPSAITSTGRKAMATSAPPKKVDFNELDQSSKPWKYDAVYTVTVFGWAAENVSDEIVSQNWNLFIPPLLTLLDDTSTSIRQRGLLALSSFVPKMTSKLLLQTGLGEVFEDAVTPTLLFLPTITPLEESLQLLPATYTALLTLHDTLFDFTNPETNSPQQEKRIKFLDRIMRGGIFTGYLHASEHPAIVEILVTEIMLLVQKMGIYSVKHLKDILPIISTVLCDPFSPSRPSLLLASIKSLQTVILNTWPRMTSETHRMEIIRALVLCWKNIHEEEEQDMSDVEEELIVGGHLLVKAVERDIDIKKEVEPLLEADPTIKRLFDVEKLPEEEEKVEGEESE